MSFSKPVSKPVSTKQTEQGRLGLVREITAVCPVGHIWHPSSSTRVVAKKRDGSPSHCGQSPTILERQETYVSRTDCCVCRMLYRLGGMRQHMCRGCQSGVAFASDPDRMRAAIDDAKFHEGERHMYTLVYTVECGCLDPVLKTQATRFNSPPMSPPPLVIINDVIRSPKPQRPRMVSFEL